MLTLQGPSVRPVNCLAYVPGPDGPSLAAGNHHGEVFLHRLDGGEPAVIPVGAPDGMIDATGFTELAASPDGDWLVGRRQPGAWLWRRRRGQWTEVGRLMGDPAPWLAFRGRTVAIHGRWNASESCWVYDVHRGRPSASVGQTTRAIAQTKPPPAGTYADKGHCCANLATLSPDGRTLATSAGEKAVQLWDAQTGEHRGTLKQRGYVMILAWAPDGRALAINTGVTVRLYDAESHAERVTWPVKYSYTPELAFSPDGRLVATTDNSMAVQVWDAATGRLRAALRAVRERRVCVAFAPDGLTLAAGGWRGGVAIWDLDV